VEHRFLANKDFGCRQQDDRVGCLQHMPAEITADRRGEIRDARVSRRRERRLEPSQVVDLVLPDEQFGEFQPFID